MSVYIVFVGCVLSMSRNTKKTMINIIRQWPSRRKFMKHGLGLVGAESIMVPSRPWSHGHHPQVWQLDDIGFTTWLIGIHCMGGINIYHFYSGWWWLMVNITGWWFQRWLLFSISLIWDVIPTPLTNSIIFQRGRLNHQPVYKLSNI
jgi:hypothetical protein